MNLQKASNRIKGFTLIELMLVLAIATILVTVAIPALNDMIIRNQLVTQINNFITALNLARSEAIKRGATISICSKENDTSCGSSWSEGWIVFVGSGTTISNPNTDILRVYASVPNDNYSLDSNVASISVDAKGRFNDSTPVFALCYKGNKEISKSIKFQFGQFKFNSKADSCTPE